MMKQKSKFTLRGLVGDFVDEMHHDLKSLENVRQGSVLVQEVFSETHSGVKCCCQTYINLA